MVREWASERHCAPSVAFAATNDANEIHRRFTSWIKCGAPRPLSSIMPTEESARMWNRVRLCAHHDERCRWRCSDRIVVDGVAILGFVDLTLATNSAAARACATLATTHTANSFRSDRSAGPAAHLVPRKATALTASRLSKQAERAIPCGANFGTRRLLGLPRITFSSARSIYREFSGSVSLPRRRSSEDFTMNTAGSSFQ